jgi:hypothetical protein
MTSERGGTALRQRDLASAGLAVLELNDARGPSLAVARDRVEAGQGVACG